MVLLMATRLGVRYQPVYRFQLSVVPNHVLHSQLRTGCTRRYAQRIQPIPRVWFNRENLVGHIDGCAKKPSNIEIPEESYEYAPTAGIKQLRAAVANLYNEIYRQDKSSKYTYENVSVYS